MAVSDSLSQIWSLFFFINKQSDSAKAKGDAVLLVLLSQVIMPMPNANALCLLYLLGTKPNIISMSTGCTPNQVLRFGVKSVGEPDSVYSKLSP